MSPREFVEKGYSKDQIEKAERQQEQIRYCIVSDVQAETNTDFIDKLQSAKYSGEDPLLSWVWQLFKKDNFKSFYKYLRFPIASSLIAKEDVEKSLERVFFADDSYKKYIIRGSEVECPEYLNEKEFEQEAFESLLYCYNDIFIHDLKEVNSPFRYKINISDVVSIKADKSTIHKIAFKSCIEQDGEEIDGYVYLDSEMFAFVPKERNKETIEVLHDIGICPASFISSTPFNDREPIVKESIYSRARPLLEQYNFLTTLQLMSDSNGAFPIVVKLATESEDIDDNVQGEVFEHPLSAVPMDGHKNKRPSSDLNAGSVHEVPPIEKNDGSYDMSVVQNYINFFRTPVDSLNYIKERIRDVKKSIIETVVGDYVEQSEESKNELQVSKSYILKQDKLRSFGKDLSFCITKSDTIMMKLANGSDSKAVYSAGTDFFIETQEDLFRQIQSAPNPIEKNNILERLSRIRASSSNLRMQKDGILYMLLPYSDDGAFNTAISQGTATQQEIILQTRFNYFISVFEAKYGNILEFWRGMEDLTNDRKLVLTQNLLLEIVEESMPEKAEEQKLKEEL